MRYAPDTIILKTRSEVKVKVTVTRKWYATLRHPKMHPRTKFGIPTSKNIGDMHRTRSGTDTRTDGRTVRLLYASQSSFGGIKISSCTVGTDVVVLVLHVVQQVLVYELWCWQKSIAVVGMKSNCLVFFYFIHSQGAIKHLLALVVENGGQAFQL